MTILEQIASHYTNKKFARITRQVSEDLSEISRGYIVGYSKDFVILQATDDFMACGYNVLPLSQVIDVRYNNHDKYYDKIMRWEKEVDKIMLKHNVNLKDWVSVFTSIKATGLNVIVECEAPSINTFTIGPIKKVLKNAVQILYFDAAGFSDSKPTSIKYSDITKVMFDDRYINIFSKYIRHRKNN